MFKNALTNIVTSSDQVVVVSIMPCVGRVLLHLMRPLDHRDRAKRRVFSGGIKPEIR